MVKRKIDSRIIDSVMKYAEEVSKKYNVETIILFGSYAKGNNHEESDIDIAIISADFDDIYDDMAKLMLLTWNIDARIEPHPIKLEDFKEKSNPFVQEIINTGIKVA